MNYLRMSALSLAGAGVIYFLISLWGGGLPLAHSIRGMGILGTAAVLALSLVNYGMRFWRWHLYTRQLGHDVPVAANCEYYVAGFSLTATPGKAGEAVRGLYLSRHGVPYADTLAMLFAERVSDLIAMLMLSGLVLRELAHHRSLLSLFMAVPVVAVLLLGPSVAPRLAGIAARLPWARARRLLMQASLVAASAKRLLSRRRMLLGLSLSVLSWSAEGLGLFLILRLLHAPLPAGLAIGIYAASVVAGALSLFPGGLGTTEAVMVLLLVVSGTDRGTALAATLICRAATLWFAILIGLLAMLHLGATPALASVGKEQDSKAG
ncbi:MAG: lysylphosphatidylglycerol synthase transmembrane domain-containing protein [Acidiferrobacteraceae bacterium]